MCLLWFGFLDAHGSRPEISLFRTYRVTTKFNSIIDIHGFAYRNHISFPIFLPIKRYANRVNLLAVLEAYR